jgi:hypothetical protein
MLPAKEKKIKLEKFLCDKYQQVKCIFVFRSPSYMTAVRKYGHLDTNNMKHWRLVYHLNKMQLYT